MDDLISRQAAIKSTWQDTGYTDPFNVMTAIRDRIEQLPPTEPQIIRCKDCEYYIVHRKNGVVPVCGLLRGSPIRNDDDFCSRAERRTE